MLKSTFIFLLFISTSLMAGTWVTNRDHSEIMFQVPYMSVSELTGRFNEFNGEVVTKGDDFVPENLVVQISAASIDTGNKMRDGHLKGSDFFQSAEHPYITFKSREIKLLKKNVYLATGELTIKGISKPSSIEFTTTDSLKDTWGYENRFVKFKSNLNRKDYNIKWNKTLDGQKFLVGDVISFWGTFQMQPSQNKTPNSKHMIPDTEYIRKKDLEKNESWISRKLRGLINGK